MQGQQSTLLMAHRYVQLHGLKKQLEGMAKAIGQSLDELEQPLIEAMVADELPSMRIDERTLFLHSILRSSVVGGSEEAVSMIKGFDETNYLVKETVNANSLSAWVREFADRDEVECNEEGIPVLPEEVASAIAVANVRSARVKASS